MCIWIVFRPYPTFRRVFNLFFLYVAFSYIFNANTKMYQLGMLRIYRSFSTQHVIIHRDDMHYNFILFFVHLKYTSGGWRTSLVRNVWPISLQNYLRGHSLKSNSNCKIYPISFSPHKWILEIAQLSLNCFSLIIW